MMISKKVYGNNITGISNEYVQKQQSADYCKLNRKRRAFSFYSSTVHDKLK